MVPQHARDARRPRRPASTWQHGSVDAPGAPRTTAYVGLGANLGDAPATMAAAIAALAALPGVRVAGVSRLYRTRAVGVADQPDFHNAVAALEVPGGADPASGAVALLGALKAIERAFGRRPRERWGPRELDLDLLVFGPAQLRVERPAGLEGSTGAAEGVDWLEVPHPSAPGRLFVLAPLSDLAPGLLPPGWDSDVASMASRAEAAEGPGAVVAVATWDPASRTWVGLRS